MTFDSSKIVNVEHNLGELVSSIRGVRKIKGCSDKELECYRIAFSYQRKDPLKDYLLIYDPIEQKLCFCADGRIGDPPENVRRRLLEKLGGNNYEKEHWAYVWRNVNIDTLCNK